VLQHVSSATLSCDTGETGHVFRGILKHKVDHIEVSGDLVLPVKLMLNVGNPESSFQNSLIPNSGVGLARIEFIINNHIKIHPLALFNHTQLTGELAASVRAIMGDEPDGAAYFMQNLARGIGKIASAFYPNDVIVRLSDFKSNEYKNLIGGELYEPNEENPMIGWRGASRYYSADYEDAFGMECKAIKYAREQMGMNNVIVMIPFCRTPEECQQVLNTMAKYGLVRGVNGLQVYLMCEIPSNVIEADLFSPLIDGVSIGGNDLLQLTIGVDRDSEKVAFLSDDKNVSYRRMISMAINTYHLNGVKVGFCGQQVSDSAEFCQFLIDQKIDSMSVTPDSAIKTIKNLGV
jgi:pyruvate,water dikinase